MITITGCNQHGSTRKCVITESGEHLSLDPVPCRKHGEGPWCREIGEGRHEPVRPLLQSILEEVNRRIPRYPRGQRLTIQRYGYPEDQPGEWDALEISLGGNDPERERERTNRAVRHILSEWLPKTMELYGEKDLAQQAQRATETGGQRFFLDIWKHAGNATDAALAASHIYGGDRWIVSPQGGQQASRRDFIGKEIGMMAETMLQAHQEAKLELDLKQQLRKLLEAAVGPEEER